MMKKWKLMNHKKKILKKLKVMRAKQNQIMKEKKKMKLIMRVMRRVAPELPQNYRNVQNHDRLLDRNRAQNPNPDRAQSPDRIPDHVLARNLGQSLDRNRSLRQDQDPIRVLDHPQDRDRNLVQNLLQGLDQDLNQGRLPSHHQGLGQGQKVSHKIDPDRDLGQLLGAHQDLDLLQGPDRNRDLLLNTRTVSNYCWHFINLYVFIHFIL